MYKIIKELVLNQDFSKIYKMNRIIKKRRHCGLDPQSPEKSGLFAGDSCFRRNDGAGKCKAESLTSLAWGIALRNHSNHKNHINQSSDKNIENKN